MSSATSFRPPRTLDSASEDEHARREEHGRYIAPPESVRSSGRSAFFTIHVAETTGWCLFCTAAVCVLLLL